MCEHELDSPSDASAFRPHFGGALANVAVAASRGGAEVALAGGVGADPWGDWLRKGLEAEGVNLEWLASLEGVPTPVAFVTFDRHREPAFSVYGEGISATIGSLEGREEEAIEASVALVFGSNTLVGERERAVTALARRLALERGLPVLFDPNLRAGRWPDLSTALGLCREFARDVLVVRTNLEEGRWLSGLQDARAEDAAEAIVDQLGARIAVVTRGADGAVMRGEADGETGGHAVEVVSPLGAGDAFMGALTAALSERDFDPARAAEALEPATEAAARACTVWQAVP